MSDFLPPPTHIEPFTLDEATGRWIFSPIWMQWFIDVAAFVTASGGGGGGAADHESLAGLLGGSAGQHYHTDNTQYTELVGNKAAHLVYAGPAAGGATTPAFRALVPGDIPTGAVVAFGLDGEEGELGDQGVPGPVGPAGQSVMGPPGLDGESAELETLGFGVTGVSITGANGIGVSGSPITSSGTIGLSLGAITPTSVTTGNVAMSAGSTLKYNSVILAQAVTSLGDWFLGNAGNLTLTGANNLAVGEASLYRITSGYENLGIGANALRLIQTGYNNVGIGFEAGRGVDSGSRNVAIGSRALRQGNTTYNVAIGYTAGYNSNGTGNTLIGYQAGYTLSTGTLNTLIGYNAGVDAGVATTITNSTGVGNGVILTASNQVIIGNTSVTQTQLNGSVLVGPTSPITLGNANKLQVAGTTAATNSLGISAWSADALGSRIELGKSRGAAIGTNTIVQDGDVVGSLLGYGANGSTFTNLASIDMEVDGTPGATNDMPGRIVFKTTPNGSGTLTEAMRLSQDQSATFAGTVKANTLVVASGTTATVFNATATTVNAFGAATALAMGAATGTTTIGNSLITAASTTGRVGIRIPSGTAPTSLTSGDFWYDGSALMFQDGVTTRTITWT